MKQILVIILCFISFASSMMADEKEDSLINYYQRYLAADLYGDYYKACINLGEILRIYKSMNEDVHRDTVYAAMLVCYAKCCFNTKDDETAINIGTEISDIYKEVYGVNTLQYVQSVSSLAGFYSGFGKYKEAIRLASEALETLKKSLGEDNPYYAALLSNIAVYYIRLSDYAKAIELGSQALEIQKKTLGEDHPDYAKSLGNLAACYYHMGYYVKAIELGSQALEIEKKTLGEDHPGYAHSLNNLAAYCYTFGDYVKAIELGSQALEIEKKTLGEEHPDYAASLNNLAAFYSRMGNYVKAIELCSQALEIQKKTLGEDHPDYALSLCNLAGNYSFMSDYAKAIELGSQALEIRKKTLGEDHPDYAHSLNNLAACYSRMGNYVKAIELGSQALEIQKKTLGEDHLGYAFSLNSLSSYYSHIGYYAKAIELGSQALEIRKKSLGENHPEYASSLNDLAACYYHMGYYVKAIELGSQALEIRKKSLGEDHPDYASSLNNLAAYCYTFGDYVKAIELGSQALEIQKKTLGEEHPDYAKSLGNLAAYNYYYLNDYKLSIQLLEKYITIVCNNVLNNFSGLTSNERQMFWNKFRFMFNDWMPEVFVVSATPDANSLLYDNIALFSKGLLLSTELEMAKLIQESGDEEAEQMYSELRQNRQILNVQYSKPITERFINCDSLERVSAELERKLGSRVEEFGDYTKNLRITWKDVQEKLDDFDVAIEYLSYPENDSTVAYVALTLCKNDTAPLLIPLFTESQLKEVAGEGSTYQNAAADSLIWGPLASRLEGKSRIYFSASGLLHRIGIEYLPSMEGKDCYRLSSTRELVTHKPSEGIKSATLFGGIDYDATYASIKSSAPSTPNNPSDLSDPSTILYAENTASGPIIYKQGGRGGLDEYNSMRTLRYSVRPLPGSRKEIQAVSALLKESKFNVQYCDTITSNLASEESFKALSGQRRSLIHISTHGFYYDTIQAKNKGKHLRMMLMSDDRPSRSEDKSLLRCGLCFAGANQFLREMKNPAEGQDEGILNALEIAQTDLRGLDLVVLSACQTALGDVVNGEGVFGLQRGFKKAGAQSILMSLWKVDDDITALLMTEFYKAWTSSPEVTKTAALKAAQDVVKEKYPDPDAWAGFILLDALD